MAFSLCALRVQISLFYKKTPVMLDWGATLLQNGLILTSTSAMKLQVDTSTNEFEGVEI